MFHTSSPDKAAHRAPNDLRLSLFQNVFGTDRLDVSVVSVSTAVSCVSVEGLV